MSHAASDARFAEGPGFDWRPRTRVLFGPGTLTRLGELVVPPAAAGEAPLGTRALVVTDPGVAAAGHAAAGAEALRAVGIEAAVFEDVRANPTTADVAAAVAAARDHRADLLIGLGGGSSMDVAKGANFLLAGGGAMRDYHGVNRGRGTFLPSVGVPTTAGTGSEAQSFALIADDETHIKMACGDGRAAFRAALLDPDVIATVPAKVAAPVAIDAVSHAVETAACRVRGELSGMFARKAFSLLARSVRPYLSGAATAEDRAAMLLGSHLAGAAIELSMLGAAHALANPLTAQYGTTHGVAVGRMLPHVVRFNAADPAVRAIYEDLAAAGGLAPSAAGLAEFLDGLLPFAGVHGGLARAGASADDLPGLAELAAEQWTAGFNPRPVTVADLEGLYRCAF
ncbi:iron-containing alcohol dehydrogenase [Alienimonas californiensis]|uniref:Alcohol dehydrogenase 2 n=1 Tax=Alienimonas californiensis TaxID=2527989 RepID=A0A517P8R1_9PLAN|nr:iron-containing alcohol dehydrogenase [Alienimonas californiensis]QDT15752.1 Alcohol dehydrogenase 2 [Alienimonas californiensis]